MAARVDYALVPRLAAVEEYIAMDCSPGGAQRNFDSYGHRLGALSDLHRKLLCDPQTSGGLLVAVAPEAEAELLAVAARHGTPVTGFGELVAPSGDILVEVT